MSITIELADELAQQATTLARRQGRTLAGLLEDYLRSMIEVPAEVVPLSPPVQELFGILQLPADFDYKTQRDAA